MHGRPNKTSLSSGDLEGELHLLREDRIVSHSDLSFSSLYANEDQLVRLSPPILAGLYRALGVGWSAKGRCINETSDTMIASQGKRTMTMSTENSLIDAALRGWKS